MEAIYQICAQTMVENKTLIIFQQNGHQEKIIKTAQELYADKNLLQNFNEQEKKLIHYIAETEKTYNAHSDGQNMDDSKK